MDQQEVNQMVKDVVNVHAEAIDDLKNFQRRIEEDKHVALLMQLNEKQMISAATYTNLILVAGYAGFFGFWSTLSPRLPLWLYSLCGLLALLSLMLFVSWEVIKMIWSGFHIAKTNSMIKTIGGEKVLQLFEASQLQYQIRSQRVWWAFLLPTVLSGLAAGFLLVGFFCYQLWQAFQ
jgi:cation transport ATPase